MLHQLRRFPLIAVLVLATAVAACGGDDPSDPDDDDDGDDETTEVTFTYVPADGGPAITSIFVRGDFNEWGPPNGTDIPMTEGANGTWSAEVDLEPGTYEFKYFFNGSAWSENMCADATWGNPSGGPVSPQSDECNPEDFNNAIIVVE